MAATAAPAQFFAHDPGVRGGPAGAGDMIAGLTGTQQDFFAAGQDEFADADNLSEGLGPRFNLDSCAGCHAQPEVGGTSPAVNPQVAIELFQSERDENPTCQFATVPNSTTDTDGATGVDTISAIEKFAFFMRFLGPPQPSPNMPGGAASIGRGKALFSQVGCALCHTPQLKTGNTTVGGRAISARRSWPTRASATRSTARRRPTGWSIASTT